MLGHRRRRTLAVTLIVSALAISGCAGAGSSGAPATPAWTFAPPAPSSPAAGPIDVIRSGAGYLVIDAAGNVLRSLPYGALPADRTTLWATSSAAGRTSLMSIDPRTGVRRVSVDLAGAWRIPRLGETTIPVGLAGGGGRLLLAADGSADPTTTSRFLVVDTAAPRAVKPLELDGWFEVDTLARDGSTGYLAERRPTATNPHGYVVRALDLAAGTLQQKLIADKRTSQTGMAGEPYAQLAVGGMAFTLYVGGATFVHALDTDTGVAVCIVFPDPATGTAPTAWSSSGGDRDTDEAHDLWALALTPDGLSVIAVNPALGILHRIALPNLEIADTTTFEPQRVGGSSASAVAAERTVVVATADGAVRIDHATGAIVGRGLSGTDVHTIERLADGRLAAVDASGVVHLLAG